MYQKTAAQGQRAAVLGPRTTCWLHQHRQVSYLAHNEIIPFLLFTADAIENTDTCNEFLMWPIRAVATVVKIWACKILRQSFG